MFRKLLDEGRAGENVGALLRGVKREDVERGQVLAKPGTIKPHTKFESEVYVLSKEEGGRHPVLQGLPSAVLLPYYRRDRYHRTAGRRRDGNAGRQHQNGCYPDCPIAMDDGLRFAIREGGRTVGAGVVAKVIA